MIGAEGSTGLGIDFRVVLVVAFLVVLAMVLAYRLMHKDPDVKRTRYGFYVERDRYEENEPQWPKLPPPVERTLPQWPDRDQTKELPPKEET